VTDNTVVDINDATAIRAGVLRSRLDAITTKQSGMCLALLRKCWPITGEEYLGFSPNHRLMFRKLEAEADRIIDQLRVLDPEWGAVLDQMDEEIAEEAKRQRQRRYPPPQLVTKQEETNQ